MTGKATFKTLKAYNTIWHPESTLVFKSKDNRIVIGRMENDELVSLDEKAIELCEKYGYLPDESLFENDAAGEDEVDDAEPEEDADTQVEEEKPAPAPPVVQKTTPPPKAASATPPVDKSVKKPPAPAPIAAPPAPTSSKKQSTQHKKECPSLEIVNRLNELVMDVQELCSSHVETINQLTEQVAKLQAENDKAEEEKMKLNIELSELQTKWANFKKMFA